MFSLKFVLPFLLLLTFTLKLYHVFVLTINKYLKKFKADFLQALTERHYAEDSLMKCLEEWLIKQAYIDT